LQRSGRRVFAGEFAGRKVPFAAKRSSISALQEVSISPSNDRDAGADLDGGPSFETTGNLCDEFLLSCDTVLRDGTRRTLRVGRRADRRP